MDCGVPYCNWGCPVGSVIPEWQDILERANGNVQASYYIPLTIFLNSQAGFALHLAKNCTLNINNAPVTIRENECAIVERAFKMDLLNQNHQNTVQVKK